MTKPNKPQNWRSKTYMSQALCAADELNGTPAQEAWRHADNHYMLHSVRTKAQATALLESLGARLSAISPSKLRDYSLELNTWWRIRREDMASDARWDEILANEARRKKQKAVEERDRAAALAKLTPYERKLLGIG